MYQVFSEIGSYINFMALIFLDISRRSRDLIIITMRSGGFVL